jgi:beta-phosphoglucomutase
MEMKAVIFDLDGVIVSTDEYHYQAWKKVADKEGIYFDREINENLRGVSRMESLEIMLKRAERSYSVQEKEELATEKNEIYKQLLNNLTPNDILTGVLSMLEALRDRNIKIAIGSSSKNALFILDKIGLKNGFDAIADGNDIKNSKPHPEVFLVAAQKLGVSPSECLVVEDANAGIDAAFAAGMKSVGVGSAANYDKADYKFIDLSCVKLEDILK